MCRATVGNHAACRHGSGNRTWQHLGIRASVAGSGHTCTLLVANQQTCCSTQTISHAENVCTHDRVRPGIGKRILRSYCAGPAQEEGNTLGVKVALQFIGEAHTMARRTRSSRGHLRPSPEPRSCPVTGLRPPRTQSRNRFRQNLHAAWDPKWWQKALPFPEPPMQRWHKGAGRRY
jgi:hypothetical protein